MTDARADARRPRRLLLAGTVALCLSLATLAGPSLLDREARSGARATHGHTACVAHRPHFPDAGRHMLIIGASYTAGLGASTPQHGYAPQLARALGQHARIAGVAGTGFRNPGPRHQGTFAQRLAHLPRTPRPDLVLFQGGRNDAASSTTAEYAAVRHTICLAARRFTHARIAVLGPVAGRLPLAPRLTGIDAALRRACRSERAIYIDALREHWMTPTNVAGYTGIVPGHPDNAGYAYVAERAAHDLRAALHAGNRAV